MRAQTANAKTQVELAQYQYLLPRLTRMWTHLDRQRGGGYMRGPGETQLETDRRIILDKISKLKKDLTAIDKQKAVQRKNRGNLVRIALVGYTNVGKSTLMNLLSKSEIFAEDKLFATLDTTSRAITLEDNRTVLLVDTVGFIRKLPHHLIEAFKSTLEEAVVADVLIHVTDVSNPEYENHMKVVENVLSDIGAKGKPVITLYNKADLAPDVITKEKGVFISAKTKSGTEEFLKVLSDTAPGKKQEITLLIPYSKGDIVSNLHTNQKVLSEDYTEDGTLITLLADSIAYNNLREYIVKGVD